MFRRYIYALMTILIAHTDTICYFLMILNHMVNANMLSLVFPLVLMGYALMEDPRPPSRFWKVILVYAEIVIFIKFILRFAIWGLVKDKL